MLFLQNRMPSRQAQRWLFRWDVHHEVNSDGLNVNRQAATENGPSGHLQQVSTVPGSRADEFKAVEMPGLEDGRHVGNGEGAGGDTQEERSDPPGVTSVRFPPARHPLPKTCAARQAAGRSSCPARRGLLRSRAKTHAGLPPVAGPRIHSDNRGRVPSAACTRPSNIPSSRLYRPW